jgi:hypothetical protein
MLVVTAVLIVFALSHCRTGAETGDHVFVDFSMAEKAIDWLEFIGSGADDSAVKEHFMHDVAPTLGCKSIIRHWRRFMKWNNHEFYRFIMEAIGRIETNDPTTDENGNLTPFGRRQLFWQEALGDPARIRRDLQALGSVGLVDTALALAKRYLPEEATIRSSFFVVLFGGSSAYAVGDANGFDLLQLPKRSDGSIDIDSVVRTFAHEMHHSGISCCQKQHMSGVGGRDRLGLVARLVNEGMPIYYINQTKERLHVLENSPNPTQQADVRDWKRYLARLPDLYAEAERDIRSNLDGNLTDEGIMGTWMAGSQGPAYVLGSEIISIIHSQLGLSAALEVARDYRRVLSVYNRAAQKANQAGFGCYVFDEELANRVANFTGR